MYLDILSSDIYLFLKGHSIFFKLHSWKTVQITYNVCGQLSEDVSHQIEAIVYIARTFSEPLIKSHTRLLCSTARIS